MLIVCMETYYRRVLGEEDPGRGRGVRWEGHLIYEAIYQADTQNTKFIPVVLEADGSQWIPSVLQSTNYHDLRTEDGYEELYRRLTNKPRADLGKLRSLPPGESVRSIASCRFVNGAARKGSPVLAAEIRCVRGNTHLFGPLTIQPKRFPT